MSAIEHADANGSSALDELPEFELTYRFDDEANPQEVTLFVEDDEDLATRWLTMDRGHAVSLETVQ
ncbi:hypothetical protein SAMN04487949_2205 [Halogranum gelatinilyticum]|uniref:Uncharacterized protein n=1 Tax=Halogranum gelatinilyticum TaxID=660521 RepID=A0A1G9UIW1_9EURY|nr:hypothetical protein [Halogranum gelatinilyticum]SDM59744.1 hypothetical protein SAMN04487949_2205 [Halogranum gelatinilyticum]